MSRQRFLQSAASTGKWEEMGLKSVENVYRPVTEESGNIEELDNHNRTTIACIMKSLCLKIKKYQFRFVSLLKTELK